jgi:hypothetical protein
MLEFLLARFRWGSPAAVDALLLLFREGGLIWWYLA